MSVRRAALTAGAAVLSAASLVGWAPAARAQAPALGVAGARVENDTTSLLAPARIAARPAAERQAWQDYVERSRRLRAADQDSMARELKRVGRDRMTKAPDIRQSLSIEGALRAVARLPEDSLRQLLATVLSFQTPSGGWSKHVDYAKGPRQTGESYFSETDEWRYIATLDNDATVAQLRMLAAANDRVKNEASRAAFGRGIEYLLAAQMPNGCWPQVFPLQGGYHDAATFNDDAIVNVLELLYDVADAGALAPELASGALRVRAGAAYRRGVGCILASQVMVQGRRTVWGQQHDPLTLAPTSARSYELVGLSGRESASVMRFLMEIPAPDIRAITAVHAAADWFRAHEIRGYDYDFVKGRVENPNAPPLWARLTEIETDRPIFANRDGVKLYDWNALTDRRSGYGWYSREPAAALKQYEAWVRKHPRPAPTRIQG